MSGGPATTIAWFNCFAGIAGDMALGSLLDAGAPLDDVSAILERLPLRGWGLRVEPVLRGGIAASRAVVEVSDDVVVRTYMHIVALIEEARLPSRVAARALDTFAALAEVEGRLHRRPPERVHFHELGAHDTVVDVVGTAAALEVLGVDDVRASTVATGTGMVRTAHGLLPNPAPAVVRLLRGVPTHGLDIPVELTTPTGAAILAAMGSGFGPLPPMVVEASGFGAGSRDLEGLPNCTQVVVGTAIAAGDTGEPLLVVETNVDDATGETLAHALDVVLESGARDAWITPVVMKKGRPGHTISALVDAGLLEQVRSALLAETGSLGSRAYGVDRWAARRDMDSVDVDGMRVRVKVSAGRVKAEQSDAAKVARHTGRPLREVISAVEAQWRRRGPEADAGRGGGPVPPEEPEPA